MRRVQRFKRTRRGDFELRLPEQERTILRSLPGQLRELLGTGDPSLIRLFPPAYPEDPELDSEYKRLVRDDLIGQKQAAVEVMEATIDAKRLSEDQLEAWLGSLNDLRLILGTKLEVTEESTPDIPEDDPDVHLHALYFYLGWLQEQVVEALSAG
jgi:hypothetical protein